MTPIPIPTDVATCDECGGPVVIDGIRHRGDTPAIYAYVACLACRESERDYWWMTGNVEEWIIRKLTQPDAAETRPQVPGPYSGT